MFRNTERIRGICSHTQKEKEGEKAQLMGDGRPTLLITYFLGYGMTDVIDTQKDVSRPPLSGGGAYNTHTHTRHDTTTYTQ